MAGLLVVFTKIYVTQTLLNKIDQDMSLEIENALLQFSDCYFVGELELLL